MYARVRNSKDLFAGLIFLGVGAGAFVQAQSYVVGTATNMGPGYFPAFLGLMLMVLGALSILRSVRGPPEAMSSGRVRPLLLILAGVSGFTFLVERAGLVPAIFVLLLCACLPRVLSRPLELAVLFLLLASFSVAVFLYGLHLPLTAY